MVSAGPDSLGRAGRRSPRRGFTGSLPDRQPGRSRRDGSGLPGPTFGPGAGVRDQGAVRGLRIGLPVHRAIPAGGPGDLAGAAPQRGFGGGLRHHAGGAGVLGVGVGERGDAHGLDPPAGQGPPRRCGVHRSPGGHGPGRGPRSGPDSPGRQAPEPDSRPGRHREDLGLRCSQPPRAARGPAADGGGPHRRHTRLHGAGAEPTQQRRSGR